MKIKFMANDGKLCDSVKVAKCRDACLVLEELLKREIQHTDAKHLEGFVQDKKRVNAVITGILKAVAEVDELGNIEEDEDIPF